MGRRYVAGLREWWNSRTATIAVAGLSRAGKTAFLTSMLRNMRAACGPDGDPERLKGLGVVADRRLSAAEFPASYPSAIARFPYSECIKALATERHWPRRSAAIGEAIMDLSFASAKNRDGPLSKLRLRVVDYPGEWLLDLVMLRMDFAGWSRAVIGRLAPMRLPAYEEWLSFVREQNWQADNSDETAKQAAMQWQKVLHEARRQGRTYLMPGRFLRGEGGGDEDDALPPLDHQHLWFCPLPDEFLTPSRSGSAAAAMARRYRRYLTTHVRDFYRRALSPATRHLVLVDVVGALAAGRHGFDDMRDAISGIDESFRSEQPGWFTSLLPGKARVERVIFAATKADLLHARNRPQLDAMLGRIRQGVHRGAGTFAPTPVVSHVAAVRCCRDVVEDEPGHERYGVSAFDPDRNKTVRAFISIPSWPDESFWEALALSPPPSFAGVKPPGEVAENGPRGIPHINLGYVLEHLVGDLLT